MYSNCAQCDLPAARYWGRYSYCRTCLEVERRENPKAHKCPKCGVEQPPQVMWRRDAPCRECR